MSAFSLLASRNFSIVTKEDAAIGAHTTYGGVQVGGSLRDMAPTLSKVISSSYGPYKSFIGGSVITPHLITFRGGVAANAPETIFPIRYSALEALSLSVAPSAHVFVVDQGGSYAYDGSNGCHASYGMDFFLKSETAQGQNDGADLIVFRGAGTICLERTKWYRQFGPSILAPFARVVVHEVGYVDGFVVARSFYQPDSVLQLHGDGYTGALTCTPTPVPRPLPTPLLPSPSPAAFNVWEKWEKETGAAWETLFDL